MSPRKPTQSALPILNEEARSEGGLRAPAHYSTARKLWWWFYMIILVKLARLRFIAILVVIGLVIVTWDTLAAYWDKWTRPGARQEAAVSDHEWFCPMHPTVIRDNPKDKCPICFMPLSKRKKGDAKEEALPAGIVNRVQLSPYRVVLAGVRTWTVDYVPLTKTITTVGAVEFNERLQKQVAARVKGRIDTLIVNETGKMVHAGDELALLYSPELVTTVENLLSAKQSNNASLMEINRTKLQRLGIDDEQINEIVASGKSNTHLKIRSPIEGHVIKKFVKEGQYVDEGMALYDIADLSTVWIQAQIYEDDFAYLPLDQRFHKPVKNDADIQTATVTVRAYPNERFQGRLTFVHPHVDPETRTVTIRLELNNPGHKLRPGATATVELEVAPAKLPLLQSAAPGDKLQRGLVVAVPESAVIDTGNQQIVYREVVAGEFEGVKVELGPRMGGPDGVMFFPVLRGLDVGNKIVTSGSFLVDAETRLNPAAGSIYFGGTSKTGQTGPSTVRPTTPDDKEDKIKTNIEKLTDPAEKRMVLAQEYCPVLKDSKLGSMGKPFKVTIEGQSVFLCCKGCEDDALANSKETLTTVEKLKQAKKTAPANKRK